MSNSFGFGGHNASIAGRPAPQRQALALAGRVIQPLPGAMARFVSTSERRILLHACEPQAWQPASALASVQLSAAGIGGSRRIPILPARAQRNCARTAGAQLGLVDAKVKEADPCTCEVSLSCMLLFGMLQSGEAAVAHAQGRRDTQSLAARPRRPRARTPPVSRNRRLDRPARRTQMAHAAASGQPLGEPTADDRQRRRLRAVTPATAQADRPRDARARARCPTTPARNGATTTSVPTRPASRRPIGPSKRSSIGFCARPATKPGTASRWRC